MRTATKTAELWFWFPATVVSTAAADGTYEVIYKGKLPPGDPSATVHVAHDQIMPEKPSPPKPLPSRAAAASKSSEVVPAARPTTAGKSLRLIRKIASEMQQPPRPTTADKSLRPIRKIASEMQQTPSPTTAETSLSLVHKVAPEMQPQPRPTTGGKSIHVVRDVRHAAPCRG
jgi:hypothetical protein